MIKKKILLSVLLSASLLPVVTLADTIVPYGNGTWIYDGVYDSSGNKLAPKAGLFVKDIQDFNNHSSLTHQINEVFPYGGDIEMYCKGDGDCTPNDFLLVLYPPQAINNAQNKSTTAWNFFMNKLGDSGYRSIEDYKKITTKTPNDKGLGQVKVIMDIDGRVDMPVDQDYLDNMNVMSKTDAMHFADKIAKSVCANDSIDGVQFDIEPFSFTGGTGKPQLQNPPYAGNGQFYFYQEIAKDFAGYYGNASDPAGINTATPDPLHCVDKTHLNGRIFSVFTFAKSIANVSVNGEPAAKVFTHHDNGYVVDSLYDLGKDKNPNHPECHTYSEFYNLAKQEITQMKAAAAPFNLPFQIGIPAAGSVHEYVSGPYGECEPSQNGYIEQAFNAISATGLRADPNFKGIDLWGWNSATWWNGMNFTPAQPTENVLNTLKQQL